MQRENLGVVQTKATHAGLGALTAFGNAIELGGGTLRGASGVDVSLRLSGKMPTTMPRIVV